MAITRLATFSGSADVRATGWQMSVPVTVPVGTSLVLLKVHQNQANTGTTTGFGVGSANMGAQAFAFVPGAEAGPPYEAVPYVRTEIWRLISPVIGAATVQVFINQGTQVAGTRIVTAVVECWEGTGAPHTGNVSAAIGNNGTSPSVILASQAGNVVTDAVTARTGHPLGLGAGQVQGYGIVTGSGGAHLKASGSDEPGAPSVTMSWTGSGGIDSEWAQVGLELVQVPPGITVNGTPASVDVEGVAVATIPGYVVAPGANRVMYVQVADNFNSGGGAPTAATYGVNQQSTFQKRQTWFRLVAPAVGTDTVTVTFDALTNAIVAVVVLDGLDQAAPNDSFINTDCGTNVTWSQAYTVVPGKPLLELIHKGGGSMNPPYWANGHGATELWERLHRLGEFGLAPNFAAGGLVTPGATPFTITWTSTGSNSAKQHSFTQLNQAPTVITVEPAPAMSVSAAPAATTLTIRLARTKINVHGRNRTAIRLEAQQ
jgi:hypothetical protein